MIVKLAASSILLILSGFAFAQSKNTVKFGSVSVKDFAPKVYAIDSNANAVVIADIGSSQIEGNSKGWFSLVYKHYKRVHILNKNGYDIADVSLRLYSNGDDEEELDKLKAVTYNLENGKVVESKLDVKANVFKDKISKNWVVKKFTLPNVKEGSIIEYEYTLRSDFLNNLQPWEFQGAYPRLWSEYNLSMPEFLGYVFLTQGYKKYDISEKTDRQESFQVIDSRSAAASERFNFMARVEDYHWVMKEVPALKEESFTSTIDNHTAKIEFQLSEYRQPLVYQKLIGTWAKLSDDLMKAEFFGQQVGRDNGWLKEFISPLREGGDNKMAVAHKIFAWIRDNFTCTNYNSGVYNGQTLRNLVKTRNGTVSEINLLLTAMLRYEDIDASPVILSTRSNGYSYSMYPLLTQYNYVVTRAIIDGKAWLLDASEPRLGFGYLPLRCYNGHARVINKTADELELNAESVSEKKFTTLFIINDEKGNLVGSMQQTPGYYESYQLRNKIKEKGKEQVQKDMGEAFGLPIYISNFVIDSLDKYEEVLGVKYDFDMKAEKEDIIYLNPMFGEAQKENPFKSAERSYPVEMPFAFDETYNLQLEVPMGYVVDELPQSLVVKLNEENEGMFEYRISQSGDNIAFRSRVRISRTYFQPEEYEMLREFFNLVVKKHAEQIVFKKKK
ncbi:MAG: DUF3857 domain-containing protein [Chitinophagaceae bacterium]